MAIPLRFSPPKTSKQKIRLGEIDTPERGQQWGKRAKQALSTLAFGKTARVEQQDVDRYGRIVGRVYVDGLDVNAEMVRQGHAWVYRRYVRDRSLLDLEKRAKEAERGLWGLSEAKQVKPWEWRRGKRQTRQSDSDTVPADAQCGTKRYCSRWRTVLRPASI
ncbi:thermonuclease family protein [Thiohalomonas denitrificans]|uniref:Nuclease homologue n=1 Tax=Thiohalomonas denitrificans TaxID=415747 RepID=A0A1G5QU09_9GAMM|nr:thermonuclease family protein [Thiohalomonas denitrificans]SCZ64711.1 nuclease homologue [Thiohalomonas denitrificans]